MKKYILVLILSLILLTSCVNNNQEEVTVIAPSGTPSLALSHYFSTHDFITKYEIVAGSDPLVSAFNNKTPSFAHGLSELCSGKGIPKSLSNSLKMFFREGGFSTSLLTENDNPSASFSP